MLSLSLYQCSRISVRIYIIPRDFTSHPDLMQALMNYVITFNTLDARTSFKIYFTLSFYFLFPFNSPRTICSPTSKAAIFLNQTNR